MTPAIPSLLYGDVERDLRATLRDVLTDQADWTAVLARVDTPDPYDDRLWKILAVDLGLAGLLVPEDQGGQGGTAREVAVVLEELGRSVAPVPFLASAVLATAALLRCGPPVTAILRRLAAGEQVACLAVPGTTAAGDPFPAAVRATPAEPDPSQPRGTGDKDSRGEAPAVADHGRVEGRMVRLNGSVPAVLAGDRADLLLVPCIEGDLPLLVAVAGAQQEVRRQRSVSLDPTRPVADVTFDGVVGTVVAEGSTAAATLEHALLTGAGLIASEQLGLAERAFDITVGYLKERRQFGRPVGSFQALKHRAADLWAEINNARAAARYAAACIADAEQDIPVAATVAKAYCSQVSVHVAEECVQLHGGIGFTWEHPAHLYLKRAMSQALLLGASDQHHARLAELLDLQAPGREAAR